MSVQKPDTTSQEQSKFDGYGTSDVEIKLLEVGTRNYTIIMRQHGDSRFFRISETTPGIYRNRVVVPMSFCQQFKAKLVELVTFASTYTICNISEKKFPRDRVVFAKSCSCFSNGGRRYYYDLVDAQNTLTFRVSYVFNGRRDVFKILAEAVPNLIEIIDEFEKKYPSLSANDDYPANNNFRRRSNNKRAMGGMRGQRQFGGTPSRGFSRGFRGQPGPAQFNSAKPSSPKEPTDGKRAGALKVLQDPTPGTVSHNAKKYLFEIVEGANTFLRITESINDNYKSSLHIPVEVIDQIQAFIVDMSKKYSSVKADKLPVKA